MADDPTDLDALTPEDEAARADVFADGPSPTRPPTAEDKEKERKRKLKDRALTCFKISDAADGKQREREIEDLQFDRGLKEDQWPEYALKTRAGGVGPDGRTTPERPCLTIPLVDMPVQQTMAEARGAKLSIVIKPRGDGASREDAEIRQGLIRAIEVDSRADIARMWALERAVKCGRGYYLIEKRYVQDRSTGGPDEFDQELAVTVIENQHSVHLDPFHKEPDASDMQWALITDDVTEDDHKRRWPTAELSHASELQLTGIGDQVPGWIGGTPEARTIRVGSYFYVEHEDRTRVFIDGVGSKWKDELPEGVYDYAKQQGHIRSERVVSDRHVKWCLFNAHEVLEEEALETQYIPIVQVVGKKTNVKGERCYKGIISNAKDAQRSYNFMRSEQVWKIGLSAKAPYLMEEGQDEGYEDMWDHANTRAYSRLYFRMTNSEGEKAATPPFRNPTEPEIAGISLAVQEALQDVRTTTGRPMPALEKGRARVMSGKARNALLAEGEQNSSVYLENLATISMTHEARILLDWMPAVYDRPGRVARVLDGEDDQERQVLLNHPFTVAENGRPIPHQAPSWLGGMMTRAKSAMGGPALPEVKHYDLTKGRFSSVVTIGRSMKTRREAADQGMGLLAQAAPQLVPLFADLWVDQMDFPKSHAIAERLRRANPAAKDEDEGKTQTIPPQVQQQLQALAQQNAQLQQAVRQLTQQQQTDAVGAQRDLQLKQMDLASRERIELLKIKKDLLIADAELQNASALAMIDAQLHALDTRLAQLHEARMATMAHEHEIAKAAVAHAMPPPRELPS